MHVIVCVKQVPGSNNVKVDEKTGLLQRSKEGNKLNPNDLFAIETALRLKEKNGGSVTALTMGPPQAAESVKEAIAMGCDNGYILSDRAFGGADVLATSYTLSQGVRKIGTFDVIVCGKQTTDGDTAQVGAELAEHLSIPHLANVCAVDGADASSLTVKAFQENLVIEERMALPCLICMDSDTNTPRLPSYKRMRENTAEPVVLTLSDLPDKDPRHYGLKGSPTQVQKIFPPDKNTDRKLFKGTDSELTGELAGLLIEKKFI